MKQRTSFVFDNSTLDILNQLQSHYHASSRAEVLRKAIALLNAASQGDEIIIKKRDKSGKETEQHVVLLG